MNSLKTEFFQNFKWHVLIALGVGVPLFFIQHRLCWVFPLCIIASGIFPKRKILLLAFLNLFFWIFTGKIIDGSDVRGMAQIVALPAPFLRTLIFFLFVCTAFLLVRGINSKFKPFTSFILFAVFIIGAVLQAYGELPLFFSSHPFFLAYFETLAENFLYILLLMRQSHLKLWDALFLRPFWGGPLPVPGTYSDILQSENPSWLVKKSGVKIIFIYAVTLVVTAMIKHLFLRDYNLKQNFFSGFDSVYDLPVLYDLSKIHFRESLNVVLTPVIRYGVFFAESISLLGIQVGFLKVMGYDVGENFFRPWVSESFLEFFKRTQSYYTRFILEIFMMPFFSIFGFIQSFSSRAAISVFCSVLFFGLFFQIFILQGVVFLKTRSGITLLESSVPLVFYYMILGGLMAVSVIWRPTASKARKEKFRWRSVFYYLLLSMLAYYLVLGTFAKNPELVPPPPQFLYPILSR